MSPSKTSRECGDCTLCLGVVTQPPVGCEWLTGRLEDEDSPMNLGAYVYGVVPSADGPSTALVVQCQYAPLGRLVIAKVLKEFTEAARISIVTPDGEMMGSYQRPPRQKHKPPKKRKKRRKR